MNRLRSVQFMECGVGARCLGLARILVSEMEAGVVAVRCSTVGVWEVSDEDMV
jgi:hypothetical protein